MEQARSHGQRELRERDLCRGPGRLTEAFGITGDLNGLDLTAKRSEVWLSDDGAGPGGLVEATPRVGLSASQAPDLPLRFVVAGKRLGVARPTARCTRPFTHCPRQGHRPNRRRWPCGWTAYQES